MLRFLRFCLNPVDELRELVSRLREHVEDGAGVIESWQETFGMVETEGGWTWAPFWDERNRIIDDYNALVRDWNKHLPLINGRYRPIGRPLAASAAQISQVLKLHKCGSSLRGIADETSLGLPTVRTIIGKRYGTDRTSQRHRERIDNRIRASTWKRQRRTGDALPKRVQRIVKEGEALVKEAKRPQGSVARKAAAGERFCASACPVLSRTMKEASLSPTDHGGGKRRGVTADGTRRPPASAPNAARSRPRPCRRRRPPGQAPR